MKKTEELIHDAAYAFAFRVLQPQPDAPRRLLVLLHGVGGDEEQLASLGGQVVDDTLVVLPRGQRSISGGMLGWYRVGLSQDGPQIVEEEAEDARLKLIEFIGQLQGRFDIAPSRTVLGGFSQGGILGASAALTAPDRVAGFAVLCGRLLPEIEPMLGPHNALRRLQALIVHGRQDETLPVEWADRAAAWLRELRIAHEVHRHDAGHELTGAMEADFLRWFAAAERSWNTAPDRPPAQ